MTAWDWVRIVGILGPIAVMLLLGFVLALRSGVAHLASADGLHKAFENASQAALLVGGCLVGLAVIQRFVGLHVGVSW